MSKVIATIVLLFLSSLFYPDKLIKAGTDTTLQIAYEAGSPSDICISDIDGHLVTCLTSMIGSDKRNPLWSPDGRFLAYQADVSTTQPTIYVADVTTLSAKKIDVPLYSLSLSDWSSDGKSLLFSGRQTDVTHPSQIYRLTISSGELLQLTHSEESCYAPVLSPNDKQIVYLCGYPKLTLNIMATDGSGQSEIVKEQALSSDDRVSWSPNGRQIAFVVKGEMTEGHEKSEIYLVDADGSDMHRLTNTGGTNMAPKWSPDGKQLVFYGFNVGAFSVPSKDRLLTEIFRINADGSGLVNLTQNEGLDYDPAWSPDGQWIAFASLRTWKTSETRQPGIFIMRPDGTDIQMISDLPAASAMQLIEAHNPVWRPIPPS